MSIKNVLKIGLAVFAACMFVGCSDDDGDGESNNEKERDPALVGAWIIDESYDSREYRELQSSGRMCIVEFQEVASDLWIEDSDCSPEWHTNNGKFYVTVRGITLFDPDYVIEGDTVTYTSFLSQKEARGNIQSFIDSLPEVRKQNTELRHITWKNSAGQELQFSGLNMFPPSSFGFNWYTEGTTLFVVTGSTTSCVGGICNSTYTTVEYEFSISGSGNSRKLTLTNANDQLGITGVWDIKQSMNIPMR